MCDVLILVFSLLIVGKVGENCLVLFISDLVLLMVLMLMFVVFNSVCVWFNKFWEVFKCMLFSCVVYCLLLGFLVMVCCKYVMVFV